MIKKIKANKVLSQHIEDTCCENEVCVTFDNEVSPDSYIILKVDKYYNSLNIEFRPASVDCLIIRECVNTGYGITLVELKKIENSKGFTIDNIKEKFQTTLFDFIKTKFKNPLDIDYSDVKLFFVSNKEIYKRDLGLKMEVLMNVRFKYNGKNFMIIPRMPNPAIKNCYS